MKHLLYIPAILLLLAACVPVIEDAFDASASERTAARQRELKATLTAAPNGWLVDYYPDKSAALGGYAMHIVFAADGQATVACEQETNLPAGDPFTSNYDILADQSVTLSFNTYNPVMHFFSEPIGSSDVDGLAGDYEFIHVETVDDRIEFIGKKWKQRLVMRRCALDFDFDAYIASVNSMVETLSGYGMFALQSGANILGTATVVDRAFNLTYPLVNGTDTTETSVKLPYLITADGIRLNKPFDFAGGTIENFLWDEAAKQYTCADPGVNVSAVPYFPPDYELQYEEILGRWAFQCTGYSGGVTYRDTVVFALKKKNASFTLTFPNLFPIVALDVSFNAAKGTIAIANQVILTTVDGNHLRFTLYNYTANSSYPAAGSYGMKGVWNHDEGGVRRMTLDNDGRQAATGIYGFLLRAYLPNTTTAATADTHPGITSGNYLGNTADYGTTNYRFYSCVLTKVND